MHKDKYQNTNAKSCFQLFTQTQCDIMQTNKKQNHEMGYLSLNNIMLSIAN